MSETTNNLGQRIGVALADWVPPGYPNPDLIEGKYCRLEPMDVGLHAEALFAAFSEDKEGKGWTYLPYGPFEKLTDFITWLQQASAGKDPQYYTIMDQSAQPVGMASYLRINPAAGSIEVGHIHFSESIKRTPLATEAVFLMMMRAFEMGYRRYEWKCDSLNAASRSAALRYGFTLEGIFRQATVYKGRNRNTAWYSILDSEWPRLEAAFLEWLDPDNFDAEGKQTKRLSRLTSAIKADSMSAKQSNNPLHGINLKEIVTRLVEFHGWEDLGERIHIRCFNVDPSINSSLKFLRRTPWAREKVEQLYLKLPKAESPTPGFSKQPKKSTFPSDAG